MPDVAAKGESCTGVWTVESRDVEVPGVLRENDYNASSGTFQQRPLLECPSNHKKSIPSVQYQQSSRAEARFAELDVACSWSLSSSENSSQIEQVVGEAGLVGTS
uniref:Uncharacterized protein n=1 Tax=Kwoniella bestiolae CBS 10118 TaxID=1296100 RepID=A0A1B9G9L5_9TREE|nr:hypothetical protein I302_02514 [Kwoniella bestiolae CBS 10118]OCF27670.1 hypothetical protein I302_02514 [Kwoniella bestiolae CBS 10118]